jgi:glycosyltransferase involved in cell wall biosynthesis
MKVLINDYSGHAFTFELSQHLSKKYEVVYSYAQYFETPKADFKIKSKNLKLKIVPIKINKKFKKDNFFLRRSMDISYGKKIVDIIKNQKPNIVICSTTPIDPLNKIISYCKKNEIKSIFWMQDIYSEAIKRILSKKIPFIGGLIGKYYHYLEKKCEYSSDKIITISSAFKKFIDKKNLSKVSVVENWSPITKTKLQKILFYKKKFNPLKKFCFIYSGTLGYKHNSKLLIEIAKRFPEAIVIISSSGKFASELKEISKKQLPNIKVTNWVDHKNLSSFLSIADAFIVTLDNDASIFSVPSKTYTYLNIGRPILASMPLANLASKKIINMKAGYVSNPENIQSFMNHCDTLINNKKIKKIFYKNFKNYLKIRQKSLKEIISLIDKI